MTNLESEIQGVINKYVAKLFEKLVEVKGIDQDDLNNMWSEITSQTNLSQTNLSQTNLSQTNLSQKKVPAPISVVSPDVSNALDPSKIMGATVPELKALCKANKLSTGGKKQDLIDRLVSLCNSSSENKDNVESADASNAANAANVKQTVPTAPKKKKRSPNRMPNIPISSIHITKNVHNNYEHPETKLVFEKESKQVIGKQQDDGTITALTEEDIQVCDQFKFSYKMPEKIITEAEKKLTSVTNDDDIVETLEDIIGSDDDGEFEEFYEEEDE